MKKVDRKKGCIFCEIVQGRKGEKFLYEDGEIVVFADIHPRTPVHLLVTPRSHYYDFSEMMSKNPSLLTRIGEVIEKLVDQLGIKGSWYTWGFHCGGKQSVNHAHAQFLAGMKGDELVL